MDSIKDFFKGLMDFVSRMTPSQVMMFLGVIAGTVAGIILVVGWLNSVTYSRLYSNLDEREAGEIVTYLNDNKIPYQLEDGGRTIEVPSNDVYKTRISLATEGLPSNGTVGYSIFDKNNLGMTDFLQNLNFRRALEGELTRTIMQLNEVQAARVHIVIPKDRLFKQDKKEATASVVLKLKGTGSLTKQQINGITHLVASSVEGLKPSNISIIDYDGNLLSSNNESDPLAGLSSSQLDVRKQVEQYLQDKAQSMLDDVLGTGESVIRVTADLDFQQIEKNSETYDPNSPSIRSEEKVTSANSTSDKAEKASESKETGNNESVITNYELNKTVEHIVNAVGSIKRLSIALMVDGIYTKQQNADGKTEMIYKPRSQGELDRLSSIVKSAVGFDQQRNDQIEIVNIAFDKKDLENDRKSLDKMYIRNYYMDIAKKVGYFLLIAFLLLWFKKKSKKLFAALSRIAPPPRQPVVTSSVVEETENKQEEIKPIEIEKRKPRLVDQMQQTAQKEPEEIAKVIKTMMVE